MDNLNQLPLTALPNPYPYTAVPLSAKPLSAVCPQPNFQHSNVEVFTCGCGNPYHIKMPYGANFWVTCLVCKAMVDFNIPPSPSSLPTSAAARTQNTDLMFDFSCRCGDVLRFYGGFIEFYDVHVRLASVCNKCHFSNQVDWQPPRARTNCAETADNVSTRKRKLERPAEEDESFKKYGCLP